jgi:hypothetical protein
MMGVGNYAYTLVGICTDKTTGRQVLSNKRSIIIRITPPSAVQVKYPFSICCTYLGDPWYLIVDPHYTGADNVKTILDKGWIGWKKVFTFALKDVGFSHYVLIFVLIFLCS